MVFKKKRSSNEVLCAALKNMRSFLCSVVLLCAFNKEAADCESQLGWQDCLRPPIRNPAALYWSHQDWQHGAPPSLPTMKGKVIDSNLTEALFFHAVLHISHWFLASFLLDILPQKYSRLLYLERTREANDLILH